VKVVKYDNTINTGFQIPACKKKKTVLCFTQKIVAACGPVVTLLLFLGVVAMVATQIMVQTVGK
jgi:hypothetical protein